MSEPTYTPGRFVWYELMSSDTERSAAFYTELFGWTISQMEMPKGVYHVLREGEDGIAGMYAIPEGEAIPDHWIGYISGEPDSVAARTRAFEGQVLVPPQTVPEVGKMTVLMDPQGASSAAFKRATRGIRRPKTQSRRPILLEPPQLHQGHRLAGLLPDGLPHEGRDAHRERDGHALRPRRRRGGEYRRRARRDAVFVAALRRGQRSRRGHGQGQGAGRHHPERQRGVPGHRPRHDLRRPHGCRPRDASRP
ncbi:MAG: VOC family protein [Myxococcota bacterium]